MAKAAKLDRLVRLTGDKKRKARWELVGTYRQRIDLKGQRDQCDVRIAEAFRLLGKHSLIASEFVNQRVILEIRNQERIDREMHRNELEAEKKKLVLRKISEKEKALGSLLEKVKWEEQQDQSRREQAQLDDQFLSLRAYKGAKQDR